MADVTPVTAKVPGAFSSPSDAPGLMMDILKDTEDSAEQIEAQNIWRDRQAQIAEIAATKAAEAAQAEARLTEAQVSANYDTQLENAAFKKAMVGDIRDPMSRKYQLATDHKENYDKAKAIRDELLAKQQVSFFDNPVEYISNQLEIPTLVQTHNLLAANANSALAEMHSVDSLITKEAQANAASSVTLYTGAAADAAKIAAQKQAQIANEWEYKAAGINIDMHSAIRAGQREAIDHKIKIWNLYKDQEHLQMQKAADERHRQMFELQLKEHGDKDLQKKVIMDTYKAGLSVLGMPLPDESKLENNYRMYLQGPPVFKEKYAEIMTLGMRKLATGDVSLGSSPGEVARMAMNYIGNFKGRPDAPALEEVVDNK